MRTAMLLATAVLVLALQGCGQSDTEKALTLAASACNEALAPGHTSTAKAAEVQKARDTSGDAYDLNHHWLTLNADLGNLYLMYFSPMGHSQTFSAQTWTEDAMTWLADDCKDVRSAGGDVNADLLK